MTRQILKPGTKISWDDYPATVINDDGCSITVETSEGAVEDWAWELEGIECVILEVPTSSKVTLPGGQEVWAENTKVKVNLEESGVREADGCIKGISTNYPLPVMGHMYIVELENRLPEYPYLTIVVPERFLTIL